MVTLEIASADAKVWRSFPFADQRRWSRNCRLAIDWDNLLWILTLFTGSDWQVCARSSGDDIEPLVVGREFVGWQFPSVNFHSSELETSLINDCIDWRSLDLRRGDWLFIGEDGYNFAVNEGGFSRIAVIERRRIVLDLCSWLPLTEECNHRLRIFVGRTASASEGGMREVCLRKADCDGWLSVTVQDLSLEIPRCGQLAAEFSLSTQQTVTSSRTSCSDTLLNADVVDSAYFYSQYGRLSIKDLVITVSRQGLTGLVRLPSAARLPPNTGGGISYILRRAGSAIVIDLSTVVLGEQYHEDSLYQFSAPRSSLKVVHFPYLSATG